MLSNSLGILHEIKLVSMESVRGVNVPMYTTLRRTTVAFTMVVEYLVARQKYSLRVLGRMFLQFDLACFYLAAFHLTCSTFSVKAPTSSVLVSMPITNSKERLKKASWFRLAFPCLLLACCLVSVAVLFWFWLVTAAVPFTVVVLFLLFYTVSCCCFVQSAVVLLSAWCCACLVLAAAAIC
uniref:Uncharacterized protein n=1 Tax=Chenopodium quinoa TaxID=63459 RepID=A0A803NB14_CHEQI